MEQTATDTEALIKAAAKKIFLKKGLAGARLQEIADEAGIGRTALHYYFRSKEKLYQVVWNEVFADASLKNMMLERNNLTIVEKMQAFAEGHLAKALTEPELEIFMLNEFNNNPEIMEEVLVSALGSNFASTWLKDIENAVKKGELKGEPKQIFITMISICMFSFAGKAMIKNMLKFSEPQYMKLMEQRKDYVSKFLATAFK